MFHKLFKKKDVNESYISIQKVSKIRIVRNYLQFLNQKDEYAICIFLENEKIPYMIYSINSKFIKEICYATYSIPPKKLDLCKELFEHISNSLQSGRNCLYFLRMINKKGKVKFTGFSNTPSPLNKRLNWITNNESANIVDFAQAIRLISC